EFGDAGRVPLLARDRRGRGRHVHGAGSHRRRSCRPAEHGNLSRHGHLFAGRPGAGQARRHSGHGGRGREKTPRAGAARRRRGAVANPAMTADTKPSNDDFWALGFAMVFPTVMAWTYFVALARAPETPRGAEAKPAIRAAYGIGKVAQFSFPVIYLGLYRRHVLRPRRPSLAGRSLGLGFGLVVLVAVL